MLRREPLTRPENMLAFALDEIERLKSNQTRWTDGRNIVTTPPDGTTPPPAPAAAAHVIMGSKHTQSLHVTAGAGLNANFEAGQGWRLGVFYSIAAGSLVMTDATTNYVFVNSAGVVATNITGFPGDSLPLATVVTAGGVITTVNDRRAYLDMGLSVDPNFQAHIVSDNPRLTFDVGDSQEYVRASNFHVFRIGTVDKLAIGEDQIDVGVDGSAPVLILHAFDGVNEGAELQMLGAAANTDWTQDNFAGSLRWHEGGNVRMELSAGAAANLFLNSTGIGAGLYIGASPGTFRLGMRYVGGNVFEVIQQGDNISLRLLTEASQTAGVVPGAFEMQAGAGNNSQGGAINITSGAGVAGASANHAGGIIGITAGDAVGTGVGGIINLTAGKSPSGADGAVSMRLRGTGITDIGPEWRVQQDQDGLGDFQNIFTVINTGMSSLLGGLALGNMLDLQNETDDAPEFGAVGGRYQDWTATAYDNATHDSRNVAYLISPRDKALYLWNTHDHGTAEEFLKVFWTGNVLKIVTDASGTGAYRDLTLDAGNFSGAASLNLLGHNVILRARDTGNGIFLDLADAAGASFVKVRDSAFAEQAEIDSDGNAEFLGYLRVGAVAAPTNVTSGDLTATRLSVNDGGSNDLAFSSANGYFVRFANVMVDTSAGAKVAYNMAAVVSPASASTSEFRALQFQLVTTDSGGTINILRPGYFEVRHRSTQTIAEITVFRGVGVVIDSSSPAAAGTVAAATVFDGILALRPSGTSTLTVTSARAMRANLGAITGTSALTFGTLAGFEVNNPPAGPGITTLIGLEIAALTRGTTNFGVRNASNSVQTGYARFGAVTAPTNVTNGDVGCLRLLVGADAAFASGVGFQASVDASIGTSGTKIGFFGNTPVVRVAAYTPTNVVADRSYDANSTTIDELADVLGTLIADLQSYGLLQ